MGDEKLGKSCKNARFLWQIAKMPSLSKRMRDVEMAKASGYAPRAWMRKWRGADWWWATWVAAENFMLHGEAQRARNGTARLHGNEATTRWSSKWWRSKTPQSARHRSWKDGRWFFMSLRVAGKNSTGALAQLRHFGFESSDETLERMEWWNVKPWGTKWPRAALREDCEFQWESKMVRRAVRG